ncbi:MAG: hypothetical protein ACI9VR_000508 [Cognaticolwellia sp.]|jgi:hypothetical protein
MSPVTPSSALLELSTGGRALLFAGDQIGRLRTAHLSIQDPRISEMHAYLSLRDGALHLLRLRGNLSLFGMPVASAALEPGVEVELAEGLSVRVLELHMPQRAAALLIDGVLHPLPGGRCSVIDGNLVAGTQSGAQLWVWNDGRQWYLQEPGQDPQEMDETERQAAGYTLLFTQLSQAPAQSEQTLGRSTRPALRIQAHFDSVILETVGGKGGRLVGNSARLITLLAELDGPAHWELVAKEIWPRLEDRERLRSRWDRSLWSLRQMLARMELPTDLVQTQGGQVELVLQSHDTIEVRG